MSFLRGRVLLSVFLILLGVTLLLNNLNIEGFELDLGAYWPVFPLLWGVGMGLEAFRRETGDGHKSYFSMSQLVTSLVVIFISAAYLGRNLELFQIDFSTFWQLFWPIVIILIGISLFRGRAFTRGSSLPHPRDGHIPPGRSPPPARRGLSRIPGKAPPIFPGRYP